MRSLPSSSRAMRAVSTLAAALTFLLPALSAAQTPPTLYERIGGYDFLARFVDTAFPRVAAEPSLSRLFRGHSVDSQMRQRQLIIDALCHEAGGPCIYIGRDMVVVHQGLEISGDDWRTFLDIISRTLAELGVAPEVRRDFLEMFDHRFRPAVVTP